MRIRTYTRHAGRPSSLRATKSILSRSSHGTITANRTISVLLKALSRIVKPGWTDSTTRVGHSPRSLRPLTASNQLLVGWLDMTSYYATAFKTGAYPAITKDKIYMWSRTHPRDANAPDPVGKPANFELVCSCSVFIYIYERSHTLCRLRMHFGRSQ